MKKNKLFKKYGNPTPELWIIFDPMQLEKSIEVSVKSQEWYSASLQRTVTIDFYEPFPAAGREGQSLLLINDGQDLRTMGFEQLLGSLVEEETIEPPLCVGIHCGEDRLNEYGMVSAIDYKGNGARARPYEQFILRELLPFIEDRYPGVRSGEKAFAGFSLGGLSALDLVWNHPDLFSRVGVFSGSLWWRSKDKNDKHFNEITDRLMHRQVREGAYHPGMQFFFECGEKDETEDRNNNHVIDAIDDTIDLMRELVRKGYREGRDFHYLQLPDGRHEVASWAKAMPAFLEWGWGKQDFH